MLSGAGCSTKVNVADKEEEKPLQTGSLGSFAANAPNEDLKLPPESDLSFAKVAAVEFLGKAPKDASMPWENPRSGARGTITPLATSYRVEGGLCRDFLASYVAAGEETWMQGEACREGDGPWEVRRLKPWRRT